MKPIHFVLLAIVLSVACSRRNRPVRDGTFPEAVSPVTVHTKINGRIKYVTHTTGRTTDGRLKIDVVLSNSSTKPMTVIAYADWLDRDGNIIERSNDAPIVIPTGGTAMYSNSAWDTRAETFSVAVRPAHTKRKDY